MPFTVQELEHISNLTLDNHLRGEIHLQNVQDKPLLRKLLAAKGPLLPGKELITKRVKGDYSGDIQGFSHDDEVGYHNPANVKVAHYKWYELHEGIMFTGTELKTHGITVVDSTTGKNTVQASDAEKVALGDLLDDKMEDLSESWAIGMNKMFWLDGAQDAKKVPGVRSMILDDPSAAITVAGIDQANVPWWRNRAKLGITASAGNAADQVLVKSMNREHRQLRRYGKAPNCLLAGSDWLDQVENELRAKGEYTNSGWAERGSIEVGVEDGKLKGTKFEYDPTLDDMGLEKYCFALDIRKKNLHPLVMPGDDMKQHNPARPENKYVYFRAVTWTGALVTWQRNNQGVYSIN